MRWIGGYFPKRFCKKETYYKCCHLSRLGWRNWWGRFYQNWDGMMGQYTGVRFIEGTSSKTEARRARQDLKRWHWVPEPTEISTYPYDKFSEINLRDFLRSS